MVFVLLLSSDTSHYENVPFEVPESWCWCELPQICLIPITDGTHQTPKYTTKEDGVPFISSKDVTKQIIDWSSIKYITRDLHEILYSRIAPQRYDILLAKNGTTGVAAMVEDERVFDIYVTLAVIRPAIPYILPKYLLYLINSHFCKRQFNSHLTGIGLPNLHLTDINKTLIPLPPYDEQMRIVQELDQWMEVVDMLESSKSSIQESIQSAKSKILDLAIRGKLIPQDANDEPASELLKRLGISSDNRPYEKKGQELPPNWSWCKLDSICSFLSRGKSPKYSETDRTYPVFAQKCNLKDGGISLEQARFLEPTTVCKWADVYKLRTGDVLVNSTGTGTVGRTRLFNESCLGDYPFVVPDSHVTVIRTIEEICSEYIYILLSSNEVQQYMEDNLAGSTNQKELYIGIIGNIDVPLPPFEEQVRIAKKVDTLYTQLEDIGAMLA